LARNNPGFQALNGFLSPLLHEELPIPEELGEIDDCFILYPLDNVPERPLRAHEFISVRPNEVNRMRFNRQIPKDRMVACPTFTLPEKEDHELHSVLRAIDMNTLVSKLEDRDLANLGDVFLEKRHLLEIYRELPEALENLKKIVSACSIDFDFGSEVEPQNLKYWTDSEDHDYQKVRQLCLEGMEYRYGKKPSFAVKRRIIKELDIIRSKGFLSYFLISWDIVSYARSKGYFYVGRGSGANSVIAYLLRITDVDPIELDLYFERFINLFRKNPPDFDIDFSSHDRDDVTQYIFNRYPNSALIATYSTFQFRAVTREVGKAFGVPAYEIEKIQSKKERDLDRHAQTILKYAERLSGFPSHLSVHAGGILISEKPIHYFTATSLPPKGFPITHFDMLIAEDVGLFKFDILGQRGLGKIKEGIEIIRQNQPNAPEIDIHDIKMFKEDSKVKENLRNANAIGCFYVESPAMRMLLTKLKADDYLSLVAASSIIRPGVARSGMMREYIQRFRVPEKRKEAHPVLWDIMPDTYGVMVYQEDVIKVAHYFAGLDLGEADVLRRGMSGKFRSREEFRKVKEKYFQNCRNKGYSEELAEDVWRQIESFAGYAFAKGHSASYAIESYQSMYLKTHYPLEFMVAVINNGGGFYRREFYVHEARLHGADIQAPCLNAGEYMSTIRDKTIYLGFGFVKSLEHETIMELLEERYVNGSFASLDDFVKRVSVSLEQVSILIRCGAFRFTGKDKKTLLWHAHFLLGNTGKSDKKPALFDPPVKDYRLPNIDHDMLEDIYDEIELLGFPFSCSPFELLVSKPNDCIMAREQVHYLNKTVQMLGYLVTTKDTGTVRGDRMCFGTFLDEEGQFIDTVLFR
jgi:DNA polymerase-3 subunit alpha